MKVYGRYQAEDEIDALVWRSGSRYVGLLIPYWRESALLVTASRRGVWVSRTYVGERLRSHRQRVLERAIARRDAS